MSRSIVPGFKESKLKLNYFLKQVCIYAYNKNELNHFLKYGRKSKIENSEDIEILRFFELGFPIKMFRSKNHSLSIDVIDDIELVEKELKLRNK
tara:strand:- start:295 stop:576 length:282 start_codon:yes stop_codon:yes gene_type:complete